MPEIDSVTGILTMPWWMAAAFAACVVVLCILAFIRNGFGRTLAGFAWFGVIAVALGIGWNIHERFAARDRADERRALDARVAELTLRTMSPVSPLACLATSAGDAVDGACEKALFASPESVAAALAYADARLILLTDASDYAARGNDYEQSLAILRRPVEADRFGFFAQAFSTRENCAAETCDAAELVLQNADRILANLKEGTFQSHVTRHAGNWGQAAGAVAAAPAAPTVMSTANFPGADAIPPVSIMNNEPGMPGQNGMDTSAKPDTAKPETTKPAQQARRPAAKQRPAAEPAAAAPAGSPGFPVPIAPPPRPATASSGSAPSAQ
jgi:hypothetical protein